MPVYRIEINRETTHVYRFVITRPTEEAARRDVLGWLAAERFDEVPESDWDFACVEGYTLGSIAEESPS